MTPIKRRDLGTLYSDVLRRASAPRASLCGGWRERGGPSSPPERDDGGFLVADLSDEQDVGSVENGSQNPGESEARFSFTCT